MIEIYVLYQNKYLSDLEGWLRQTYFTKTYFTPSQILEFGFFTIHAFKRGKYWKKS